MIFSQNSSKKEKITNQAEISIRWYEILQGTVPQNEHKESRLSILIVDDDLRRVINMFQCFFDKYYFMHRLDVSSCISELIYNPIHKWDIVFFGSLEIVNEINNRVPANSPALLAISQTTIVTAYDFNVPFFHVEHVIANYEDKDKFPYDLIDSTMTMKALA